MSRRSTQTKFPRLIVMSAPSGAGKSTLCEMLLAEFPNIVRSISVTTRAPRADETNGIHYYFVSREEFEKKVQAGEFAEHAVVHGQLYGTLKSTIDDHIKNDKNVVFTIDIQGADHLCKLYADRALTIFLLPPSMEILAERLRKRQSDSSASIETRLQNAYNELEWSKRFDYQIVNDELKQAYSQLKEIVKKECR